MFIGTKNRRTTVTHREMTAQVVFGEEILRVGMQYFIMDGRRCTGVGTILSITMDRDGTSIDYVLDEVAGVVKKFAEMRYALITRETAGPRTYAETAGTDYHTSTMDGATAMMMGEDMSVSDLARGKRGGNGPSIAEMMGWTDDD